ncbi:MAG: tetratricopeptide repeat protein [Cyanobacteria bacterium SZAS-4]|nr:tetratricopeptide repeat protein [Cyanobacteria bacterium SZAS-4]
MQTDGPLEQAFADHYERGQKARLSGDFAGALTEYGAALKVKDAAKAHIKRGDVFVILAREDEAIVEYQAAAKAGDTVEIELKIGKAYQLKKEFPNAIDAYEKAFKLDPKDPFVQDALVSAWEVVVRGSFRDPMSHIGLGKAYERRGDFGQAELEYTQARDLHPGAPGVLANKMLKELAAARAQAKAKAAASQK